MYRSRDFASRRRQWVMVTVEIYDDDQLVTFGTPCVIEVPNAKLWSAEAPNLYTCVVRTEKDEKRLNFGIRELKWSAKTGIPVNGQRTLLRGG